MPIKVSGSIKTETAIVGGVELVMTKRQVVVSPPDPDRAPRYYANINVNRKELMPVGFALSACWTKKEFLTNTLNRDSVSQQGPVGFWFHSEDDHEEPPVNRFDLVGEQRGVIWHYLDEDVETSVEFFVDVVIEFGTFCIRNGLGYGRSLDELKELHTLRK